MADNSASTSLPIVQTVQPALDTQTRRTERALFRSGNFDPKEYQPIEVPDIETEINQGESEDSENSSDEEELSDQESTGRQRTLRSGGTPKPRLQTVEYEVIEETGVTVFQVHGLGKDMAQGVAGFLQRIQDDRNKASEHVKKMGRVKSLGEFEKLLPLMAVSDEAQGEVGGLTLAEKESIREEWQRDPQREQLLESSTDMRTLYKTCLRLWKCVPEDIISRQFYLVYDQSQNIRGRKDGKESLIWSTTFCKHLCALIPHDVWATQPSRLATAIFYVVKVDKHDLRPWSEDSPVEEMSDMLPMWMAEEAARPDNEGASVVDVRKQVVQKHGPSSWWNWLFCGIESVIQRKRTEIKKKVADQPSWDRDLQVHNRHLEILIEAIDGLAGPTGFPPFLPLSLIRPAVNGARSVRDFPTKSDIRAKDARESLAQQAVPQVAEEIVDENEREPEAARGSARQVAHKYPLRSRSDFDAENLDTPATDNSDVEITNSVEFDEDVNADDEEDVDADEDLANDFREALGHILTEDEEDSAPDIDDDDDQPGPSPPLPQRLHSQNALLSSSKRQRSRSPGSPSPSNTSASSVIRPKKRSRLGDITESRPGSPVEPLHHIGQTQSDQDSEGDEVEGGETTTMYGDNGGGEDRGSDREEHAEMGDQEESEGNDAAAAAAVDDGRGRETSNGLGLEQGHEQGPIDVNPTENEQGTCLIM
ncbi:hypothetical protein QBC37DRAFT_374328 [Rhypophila decipiens]|uniref:Uncharacterized protein n=1 Tax=Rhypophila decipiens TaxID=261697 RepID=A0AAN7B6Y0_9PEZI|nr:hypothetical protein QBC37DRAFT_374328 [Rhypophila decipiens]